MGERQDELDRSVSDAYRRLKRPVLRRARRWFPSLAEADLEDVYQAAWLSVVRTEAEVRDIEDYVYRAVHSQGLMELRRRRRRPVAALGDVTRPRGRAGGLGTESEIAEPADETTASPEERAEAGVMAAWACDLLEELSARQRSVVKLRWGWGLSRREIARLLRVSEKAVKRDLEASGRRLSESVEELDAGRWCERRRSVVTAYALELLSQSRAARAEAHLRACSGCRGLVRELRRRAEDVAGLVPAPILAEPSARGLLEAVGAVLDSVRSQASDLVSGAKQHAVSLSVRATDPTPLAGARPGTVAAAVAGCLAVGTGAFCAVEGAVPEPLRVGPLAQQRASADPPEKSLAQPVARESQPAEPVPPPPQLEAPAPVAEPAPPAHGPPSAEPDAEAEPSQDFFGGERSESPVVQAAGVQSAPSAAAPAPAAPRGEFGGP